MSALAKPAPSAQATPAEPRLDPWLVALLCIAALYVFWDAGRSFSETDDFWYAEITLRMIEEGDYLTPRLGPDEDWSKPPLYFWLSAPWVRWLPSRELAMRLVPGLCFLAQLALLYAVARRLSGRAVARTAAAVFLLTYDHLHLHVYRAATMDGLVNLLTSGAFALLLAARERPRLLAAVGALAGAIFLTKSTMAAVPVLLAGAAFVLTPRAERPGVRACALAVAAGAGVVLPWLLAVLPSHGAAVYEQMVAGPFLNKALGVRDPTVVAYGGVAGRSEPLYFVRHLLSWGQPWILLAPIAVVRVAWEVRAPLDPARRAQRLAAVWVVTVVGLFSLLRGWGWYVSSIYFPLALLVGLLLTEYREGRLGRWEPLVEVGAVAALFALPAPFLHVPYTTSSGRAPLDPLVSYQVGLALVLLAGLALWRRGPGAPWRSGRALLLLGPIAVAACALSVPLVLRGGLRWALIALLPLLAWLSGAAWGLRSAPPARRTGTLVTLFVLAAGILLAPLRFASEGRQRGEVERVRAALAAGERHLQFSASIYSYVVVYHTFAREYDVSYDRARGLLTISASEQPRTPR